MAQLILQSSLEHRETFSLLVIPFWQGAIPAAKSDLWEPLYRAALDTKDFQGKKGEALCLYPGGDRGRIVLLGLGNKTEASVEEIRRAYSAAARIAQQKKIQTMHVLAPLFAKSVEGMRGVVEGILLTNYFFSYAVSEPSAVLLDRIVLVGSSCKEKEVRGWQVGVLGTHLVRDLVNSNADDINSSSMVEWARSLVEKEPALRLSVLNRSEIEREKMGLFLAVNRGAAMDPSLILLSYNNAPKNAEHIALVGKGITYDTGGLALKPADGMVTMKCDMSGAAVALTTVYIAALLELPVHVTGVAPMTENAIDAKSYKNGDVYPSMNGKTVEIINTDAEGRLILADAITYAIRCLKADLIVDIASLTGGAVVALGEEVAAVFSNQDKLAEELLAASAVTGEAIWRMPLVADYRQLLKSDIADLMNSAGRPASAITAALFLQEFCESVAWAHLDIAGSCFYSKPKHYITSRATGMGVRLLVEFLSSR